MSFVFLLPQQQHWQLHWQRPFELVAACFQMQPACQRQLDWPRFHFHGWGTYRNSKWDVAVVFIGCIIIIINQEREISPSDSSNNKGKEKENSKRREVKRCFPNCTHRVLSIICCLIWGYCGFTVKTCPFKVDSVHIIVGCMVKMSYGIQ